MPTYVYETLPLEASQAPRRFELRQSMKDAALTHDPESGLPVRRVFQTGYLSGMKSVAPINGGDCCGPSGGACCN